MNIHGAGHVSKSHINFADSDVNKKNSGNTEQVGQTKTDFNDIRSLKSQLRLSESDIAARKNLLNQIKANVDAGNLTTRDAAESVANAILDS